MKGTRAIILAAAAACVALSGCTKKSDDAGEATKPPSAADRAQSQLAARLNAPVKILSSQENKSVNMMCGEADVGGKKTAFVMNNGFLILPADRPDDFAALQATCTAPAPAAAPTKKS